MTRSASAVIARQSAVLARKRRMAIPRELTPRNVAPAAVSTASASAFAEGGRREHGAKVGDLSGDLEHARDLLWAAAGRAKRGGNVAFPPTFVLAPDHGSQPPLDRLIQGRRGCAVRLRLYLCITMMATGAPYDITGIARSTLGVTISRSGHRPGRWLAG
jgi:hypothetical protein